ncbi:hypothetical protein IB233_04305 [Comamonas sp. CMM01]|nr:hypothetical protein [Comamonas sp. CMM01]
MSVQPLLAPYAATHSGTQASTAPPVRSTVHEEIRLHLDERGFVPFHPLLAEKLGHKAAIFVGMSLYWTRHSLRNHPKREGWFHMSIQQWQQSIGLSRTEQATVRELLLTEGLLEENLIGRPAVMHYRLNVASLTKFLAHSDQAVKPSWETVSNWFRGCQNYYKPLADVVGSIAAGLYMSFVLQRHRECLLRGQIDNGCITVHQDEIATALSLGPKVQRNARERLKRSGLIQEASAGGSLLRINMEALLMCLRGQAIKPLKQKRGAKSTDGNPEEHLTAPAAPIQGPSLDGLSASFLQLSLALPNSASKPLSSRPRDLLLDFLSSDEPVGNRQVRTSPTNALAVDTDSEKSKRDRALLRITVEGIDPQPGGGKNAVSCKLDSENSAVSCKQELPFPATYIQGINTTTTTLGRSSSPREVFPKADPSTLFITNKLSDNQRDGVLEVLGAVPEEQRQQLLDELEGHLLNKAKAINNPAGWLFGLIRNLGAGPVVFVYAKQVAEDRKQRQELLDRQSKNAGEQPKLVPTPTSSIDMYSPEARARRAQMRDRQTGGRKLRGAP